MSKYIGIDPDVKASGFAVWDSQTSKLTELKAYEFYDLLERLDDLKGDVRKIIIEAGWLNKCVNFHGGGSVRIREKIAHAVGENHRVGKFIEEYCIKFGLNYELYRPCKKKTTKKEFEYMFGIKLKNQDIIDAAMLVVGR